MFDRCRAIRLTVCSISVIPECLVGISDVETSREEQCQCPGDNMVDAKDQAVVQVADIAPSGEVEYANDLHA